MHRDYEKELEQFNAEVMEDYRRQKRINQKKARLKLVCFSIGAIIIIIMLISMVIGMSAAMKGFNAL